MFELYLHHTSSATRADALIITLSSQLQAARSNNKAAYAALCAVDATGAGCASSSSSSSSSSAVATALQTERWGPPQCGGHWTMQQPKVRLMGSSAVVCYQRAAATISASADGSANSEAAVQQQQLQQQQADEETRVWRVVGGAWRQVHLHRSTAASHHDADGSSS
jgi:Calcium/calmodulin dependent protein kinase II association domain